MDLTEEQLIRYEELANAHVEFLCDEVFKPAFKMGFLRGAKHMYEEVIGGLRCAAEMTVDVDKWYVNPVPKKKVHKT